MLSDKITIAYYSFCIISGTQSAIQSFVYSFRLASFSGKKTMTKVFKSWGLNCCKCHCSKPGGQEACFGNKDRALNNAPISFGWTNRLCAKIWFSRSASFKAFDKFCVRSVIPNLSSRTPCVVNLLKAHPEFLARISKSTCAVSYTHLTLPTKA